MKKLTVKDFIGYNNPCFSCGEAIELQVCFETEGVDNFLHPVVHSRYLEIDLHIRYVSTLKLWIFHGTNKILSSDVKVLTEYLAERKIVMISRCRGCHTFVRSQPLIFDLRKGVVQAITIEQELLMLFEGGYQYRLMSVFKENTTSMSASKIEGVPTKNLPMPVDMSDAIEMELPLLPIYTLKSRQALISKLRTYITFS